MNMPFHLFRIPPRSRGFREALPPDILFFGATENEVSFRDTKATGPFSLVMLVYDSASSQKLDRHVFQRLYKKLRENTAVCLEAAKASSQGGGEFGKGWKWREDPGLFAGCAGSGRLLFELIPSGQICMRRI
jgi:hypothetical protein